MASRGSVAKNSRITDEEYKTISILHHGEKVIEGIGSKHSMPDYSHSPNTIYVIYKEGSFRAMRVYGGDHMPIIEITYHPEPNLNNGDREHSVWHMHVFNKKDLTHNKAKFITNEIKQKYKELLEDIGYDQW